MKKLFIFSIICLFTQFTFSQTAYDNQRKAELVNDPKYLEFKKRHDDVTMQRQDFSQPSLYFGYDEKLKAIFTDGIISSQAPNAQGFTSKKEYLAVLNDWISKNKHLLKPENKNSLIIE